MKLENYHRIYFVGIGGIGMSALAQWFVKAGFKVAGYDRVASEITKNLAKIGVAVFYDDSEGMIPDEYKLAEDTLVIYTPAIPKSHQGLIYFRNQSFNILKRSEALGLLVKDKSGIAIAGTHGKTSISSNTAWLLNESCSAFLGGIAKNLQSNVIVNPDSENVVIEADEFDRSFLTLHPSLAVISAIDADHLDIYKDKNEIVETFYQFIKQIKNGGILVYKNSLEIDKAINQDITYYTYSLDADADFYALNICAVDGFYEFDLKTPFGIIEAFKLGVPGLYNLENAIAALAMALFSGALPEELKEKLASYEGVKRRFDYQIRSEKLVFIDDYAHHPEEIKACINSIKHLYPGKTITGIFQPHLFTRTRDFADEFAKSLSLCDQLLLTNIYPAREEPIKGITSEIIFDKIESKQKKLLTYDNLLSQIKNIDTDIIVTMGAGDIDLLVAPIKEELLKRNV
ncbi:MAG: UDP-N-acetylmuramate--L-alanine ligase [Salinivirgaceae bacterium]|nr:UDP-N-acetylmuramate--L-alanine ligase [Salinivirgaceae bacterium]